MEGKGVVNRDGILVGAVSGEGGEREHDVLDRLREHDEQWLPEVVGDHVSPSFSRVAVAFH